MFQTKDLMVQSIIQSVISLLVSLKHFSFNMEPPGGSRTFTKANLGCVQSMNSGFYFASFWQTQSFTCCVIYSRSTPSSSHLVFLSKLFGYSFPSLTLCRKNKSLRFTTLKRKMMGPHIQLWCFFRFFCLHFNCITSSVGLSHGYPIPNLRSPPQSSLAQLSFMSLQCRFPFS